MSDIDRLRDSLFATLEALQDKNNPMDIERAKAVCDVSQVIINAAKVEVDFARVNGSVDSKFFHKPEPGAPRLTSKPQPDPDFDDEEPPESGPESHKTATGTVVVNHINGQRIVTHRLK